MPDTLGDIGISASTAQAARAAKLAAWKVMLQDWREVGPHTTVWTAERDEDARKLATQQQEFNENPFSDERHFILTHTQTGVRVWTRHVPIRHIAMVVWRDTMAGGTSACPIPAC